MNYEEFHKTRQAITTLAWQTNQEFAIGLQRLGDSPQAPPPNPQVDWKATTSWGLDVFFLHCIQTANLAPHPRRIEVLNELLGEHNRSHPNQSVDVSFLEENGWVRIVKNRWSLPQNFITGSKRTLSDPKGLLPLLQSLNSCDYGDSRDFLVDDLQLKWQRHKAMYSTAPDWEWMVEQHILTPTSVNVRSIYVQEYSEFLAANLWSDYAHGPVNPDERLSWWLELTGFFSLNGRFVNQISMPYRQTFLEAAVQHVLTERSLVGWGSERNKLRAEVASAHRNLDSDDAASQLLPLLGDDDLSRLRWCENPIIAASPLLDDAREDDWRLLYYVLYSEGQATRGSRSLLTRVIDAAPALPSVYCHLYSACLDYGPSIIAGLIASERLDMGIVLLSLLIQNHARKADTSLLPKPSDELDVLWETALAYASIQFQLEVDTSRSAARFIQLDEWLRLQLSKTESGFNYRESVHRIVKHHAATWRTVLLTNPYYETLQQSYLETLLATLVSTLELQLVTIPLPVSDNRFFLVLWLCDNPSVPLKSRPSLFRMLAKSYIRSIGAQVDYLPEEVHMHMESHGLVPAMRWLAMNDVPQWRRVLNALRTKLSKVTEEPSEWTVRRQKARLHLRLLTHLIRKWRAEETNGHPEGALSQRRLDEAYNELCEEFTLILTSVQPERADSGSEESGPHEPSFGVDAFSPLLEHFPFTSYSHPPLSPLMQQVAEAVNQLDEPRAKTLLANLIKETSDPRRLLILFNHLTRHQDKEFVLNSIHRALANLPLKTTLWPEIQSIVDELLQSERPELATLAADVLRQFDKVATDRNITGWKAWAFTKKLQIAILTRNFDTVDNTPVVDQQLQSTQLFYQGLAFLERGTATNVEQAIRIFRDLHASQPDQITFSLNLLNSYIRYVETLGESQHDLRTSTITQGQTVAVAMECALDLPNGTTSISLASKSIANLLYWYRITGEWAAYRRLLSSISTELLETLDVGLCVVHTNIHLSRWDEAKHLLTRLEAVHGPLPTLLALRNDLANQREEERTAPPSGTTRLFDWYAIATALGALKTLPNEDEKARAYFQRDTATYANLITKLLWKACLSLKSLPPQLRVAANEDTHTKVLNILMEPRLSPFGWNSTTQLPMGYSGSIPKSGVPGQGETDVVIRSDGRILAIVEAIRLENFDEAAVREHILKVRGYDDQDCRLYYQIVWSTSSDPQALWNKYREFLKIMNEWNRDYLKLIEGPIPNDDLRPLWSCTTQHEVANGSFTATYVHILVDVASIEQQEAARAARAKSRTKKKAPRPKTKL